MHIDDMGKFIKELREEKNMTQEQLAELIPISRQAVSKWERGLAIPDSVVLLKLSDLFNVSINEILSGERLTKENEDEVNNVSLSLYTAKNKKSKVIKILVLIIIIFIIFILAMYFWNSYKKVIVYTVTGFGNNVEITNGILIKTNEKIYFNIGNIKNLSNEEITMLTLYYTEEDTKKVILNTTNQAVLLIDYNGYNEYFEPSKIPNIIHNMYLEVTSSNSKETIKLQFDKDYVNDSIFFPKKTQSTKFNKTNQDFRFNFEEEYLINCLKNKYNLIDDNYVYKYEENDSLINITFVPNLNNLQLSINQNNIFYEDWIYQFSTHSLIYQNYETNENFIFQDDSITCNIGNCDNSKILIQQFYDLINKSIE